MQYELNATSCQTKWLNYSCLPFLISCLVGYAMQVDATCRLCFFFLDT